MGRQRINNEDVEVGVLAPDGTTDTEASLTEREVATIAAVDASVRANAQFQAAYPGAHLERVESMRGIDEHRNGRYYLRYRYGSSAAEFWGHLAKVPKLDFKKGLVGVTLPGLPPHAP
jgi:hypothetical protein